MTVVTFYYVVCCVTQIMSPHRSEHNETQKNSDFNEKGRMIDIWNSTKQVNIEFQIGENQYWFSSNTE